MIVQRLQRTQVNKLYEVYYVHREYNTRPKESTCEYNIYSIEQSE